MNRNDFTLLARVPVDSGQLLLVDPCYIDGRWRYEPFEDIRKYRHKVTGKVLQYRVDFERYDDPIAHYDGLTMNELVDTGEWEQVPVPVPSGLSYNSISRTTVNEDGGNVTELAAAFRTGYGDGYYPVLVRRDKDGRIMQVLIDFSGEPAGKGVSTADLVHQLALATAALENPGDLSEEEKQHLVEDCELVLEQAREMAE